jgi:hypothetical protein
MAVKDVCRSYRNRGECRWGDKCTFEHSRGAPILPPQRKAVAECFVWTEAGACEFGANCRFRHGDDDPRFPGGTHDVVAELCRNFKKGRCKLGEHCPRKHEEEEPARKSSTSSRRDDVSADSAAGADAEGAAPPAALAEQRAAAPPAHLAPGAQLQARPALGEGDGGDGDELAVLDGLGS